MYIRQFGTFGSQFGLIKGSCEMVSEDFLEWQNSFLSKYGFRLSGASFAGTITDALQALLPRTVPITTKYLFWPLNQEWTLYFDNGHSGTDASPPAVLASRLHTDGIRVSIFPHRIDPSSREIIQYGATIFEYYENEKLRRCIYAANDGGKWVFGLDGNAFHFEEENAYAERLVRNRFTPQMLLRYLNELNACLDGSIDCSVDRGPGKLIVKHGQMPRDLKEYYE